MSYIDTHKKLCQLLQETYIAKNDDYGDSFSKGIKEFGYVSALTRMYDKHLRLKQLLFYNHDQKVVTEKALDTALDLANYAIMLAIELHNSDSSISVSSDDILSLFNDNKIDIKS